MALKLPKIDLNFLREKKKPLHIAIDASNLTGWAEKNKKEPKETAQKNIEQIKTFMHYQIKQQIPIITLNLSAETDEEIAALNKFFKELDSDKRLEEEKMRIFVIGDWYNLDIDLTDAFKSLMEKTKDHDQLFLNFCIKYDGQEEMLGVIRLLATKAKLGKIELDNLTKDEVKQNLYTSYFTPPEIIIEPSKVYSGLLLWDAKGSKIYQTRKHWLDLSTSDIEDAISWANRE